MPTADLIPDFLKATEAAAIAASSWRGLGDGKGADGAAVEAMRAIFDAVPFDGRVAIGEGERDDAPMLWIGEPLGSKQGDPNFPSIDIAVDPLECTNHVANDLPNAMAVLAAAPRGTLLHAPDCYMDKIAGPSEIFDAISLEADVDYNIEGVRYSLAETLSSSTKSPGPAKCETSEDLEAFNPIIIAGQMIVWNGMLSLPMK